MIASNNMNVYNKFLKYLYDTFNLFVFASLTDFGIDIRFDPMVRMRLEYNSDYIWKIDLVYDNHVILSAQGISPMSAYDNLFLKYIEIIKPLWLKNKTHYDHDIVDILNKQINDFRVWGDTILNILYTAEKLYLQGEPISNGVS